MSPDDLAAIRALHGRVLHETGAFYVCHLDGQEWPCHTALAFAEVDRLREERDYGPDEPGMCECGHDMDAHCGGMVLLHHDGVILAAERERIVEAVQRLPVYAGADYTSGRVDRAAVLAAIDGEAT